MEMRVESEVDPGEEVMNCYGQGIGDGRLLMEWGFVGEEFAGDGLVWEVNEIGGDEAMRNMWTRLMNTDRISTVAREGVQEGPEHDMLLCSPADGRSDLMNLNQSGELSVVLFGYLYLLDMNLTDIGFEEVGSEIIKAVREVEMSWRRLHTAEPTCLASLPAKTIAPVGAVLDLLDKRLSRMNRPELTLDQLFEMRDVGRAKNFSKADTWAQTLPESAKLQRMAMTLAMNERVLLSSAREKWLELVGGR